MDGGVFINYRGEDSYSYAALLYVDLVRRVGPQRVFLDSESISAGADFTTQLLQRVRAARILLAVIGPRWLGATSTSGARRLDDPADWTRRELVEALAAGVTVIPILTDDATMPSAADLPAALVPLSRCQYRRLRHRDVTADLDRIAGDLAVHGIRADVSVLPRVPARIAITDPGPSTIGVRPGRNPRRVVMCLDCDVWWHVCAWSLHR